MSVQITYFVHGATTDNEKKISSGWHDAPLSELGIKEAEELKNKTQEMKFDAVFCSDLKRAEDSANIAFGGKAPIFTDERLRECNYGKYNAMPTSVVEPMCEGECIDNKFPQGESYEDVKERMVKFLAFLREKYDGKHIAIVSHKAPQLALDVLLKGKSWHQALKEDWRKTLSWQPGWEYKLE